MTPTSTGLRDRAEGDWADRVAEDLLFRLTGVGLLRSDSPVTDLAGELRRALLASPAPAGAEGYPSRLAGFDLAAKAHAVAKDINYRGVLKTDLGELAGLLHGLADAITIPKGKA